MMEHVIEGKKGEERAKMKRTLMLDRAHYLKREIEREIEPPHQPEVSKPPIWALATDGLFLILFSSQ